MKAILNVSAALLTCTFFISCNSGREQKGNTDSIPAPLQEHSSVDLFLSKRGGENMVDAIYADLVKKRPDLKKTGRCDGR